MDLNNGNIPESKKKELLDIAHNILPDGAEYDVFSENISKEIKPTLLYNDISSEQTEKQWNAEHKNENRQDDCNAEYDVFSENEGTVKEPDQNMKREYLDAIFHGGIDFENAEIRMTRSGYIADYNKINEYYDREEKKCKKNFLRVALVFAFGIAVLYMIELLQINSPGDIVPGVVNPIYRILNGFRAGVFVANPVICGFFLISTIKSIKKAKASRKKALDRLEQRKHEFMILGLYDTAN